MGMPWDSQPPPSNPPPYSPPQYSPPPSPQQMQPDVPVTARNQQTGETVRLDIGAEIRAAIQQAVSSAVTENKGTMQANAQRAMVKAVQGKKPTVSAPQSSSELEGDFEMGPATKRTLLQGLAIDVGFASLAALGTIMSSDFNPFEKEAWTLVAVLMIKTVMQTGMSYMMRLKVD